MAKYTLILLSDLHIGRSEKELNNTNKIVKSIGKSYEGIPVIITGDLTQSATKGQFKMMRDILRKLAKTNPILTAPGNHDYAWYGIIMRSNGWKNWVKYLSSPLGWGVGQYYWMGKDYEPEGIEGLGVLKHKSCVYFGIDSGDPKDKEACARGYISTKLADALKNSLKKYHESFIFTFINFSIYNFNNFIRVTGKRKIMCNKYYSLLFIV